MQIAAILGNEANPGIKDTNRPGKNKNTDRSDEMPFGEVMQQLARKNDQESSSKPTQAKEENAEKIGDSEENSNSHKKARHMQDLRNLQLNFREKAAKGELSKLTEKVASKLPGTLNNAQDLVAKLQEGAEKTETRLQSETKHADEEASNLKGELSKAQAKDAAKTGSLEKTDKVASQASAFKKELQEASNQGKNTSGQDVKAEAIAGKGETKDIKADGKEAKEAKEAKTDAKEKISAGDKMQMNQAEKSSKEKQDSSFKEELQDFQKSRKDQNVKESTPLTSEKISPEHNEITLRTSEAARVNNQPRVLPEQTLEQIIDKFKILIDGKNKSLEVHLTPASLGKVQIALQSIDGIVTARIVAENMRTAGLLDTNMQQIKDNLESQGIKVDDFEVNTGRQEQSDFTGREDQKDNKRNFSQINQLNKETELLNNPDRDTAVASTRLDILA